MSYSVAEYSNSNSTHPFVLFNAITNVVVGKLQPLLVENERGKSVRRINISPSFFSSCLIPTIQAPDVS